MFISLLAVVYLFCMGVSAIGFSLQSVWGWGGGGIGVTSGQSIKPVPSFCEYVKNKDQRPFHDLLFFSTQLFHRDQQ